MFSAKQTRRKALSELEQVLMDYVWAHPGCTVEMVREALIVERPLKDSTIRTILRRLGEKGYLTHDVDGRTYRYRASDAPRNVAAQAVWHIINRFCGGSVEELLVGMVDNEVIGAKKLQKLAEKIASKKE